MAKKPRLLKFTYSTEYFYEKDIDTGKVRSLGAYRRCGLSEKVQLQVMRKAGNWVKV